MSRIFDCVILSYWGEMGLLEKRFEAYKDDPRVTHVIAEMEPGVFTGSDLAGQWRGRWNHVLVRKDEITGNREACLRDFLVHGLNGDEDDMIRFGDIKDVPGN